MKKRNKHVSVVNSLKGNKAKLSQQLSWKYRPENFRIQGEHSMTTTNDKQEEAHWKFHYSVIEVGWLLVAGGWLLLLYEALKIPECSRTETETENEHVSIISRLYSWPPFKWMTMFIR